MEELATIGDGFWFVANRCACEKGGVKRRIAGDEDFAASPDGE